MPGTGRWGHAEGVAPDEPQPPSPPSRWRGWSEDEQWHDAVDRAFALADAYPARARGHLDAFAGAQVLALLLEVQAHEQQCRPGEVPLHTTAFLLDLPFSTRLEHYLEVMGATRHLRALNTVWSQPPGRLADDAADYRNASTDALDIVTAAILADRGGVQIGDPVRVLDQQFQDLDGPAGAWSGTITSVQLQFRSPDPDQAAAADPLLFVRPDQGASETAAQTMDTVLAPEHRDQRRVVASLHYTAHARLEAAKHRPDYLATGALPRYLQRLATLRHDHADAITGLLAGLLTETPAATASPPADDTGTADPQLIGAYQAALDRLLSE